MDNNEVEPVLLLSLQDSNISAEKILRDVQAFDAIDDVFCEDFLSRVLIIQVPTSISTDLSDIQRALRGSSPLNGERWDLEYISLHINPNPDRLPSGPYFLNKGQVHQACRLYCDHLESFQTAVVPAGDSPYR